MNVYQKLQKVQEELKVPKNQFNSFGKYKYRNCEDILEGLKPSLAENGLAITITDTIEQIGDRFYVVATVELTNIEKMEEKIVVQARAREDDQKKGMDVSQLTGSTSSYARKYALNGMFAIDDTKDADTTNTHDKGTSNQVPSKIDKNKADTLIELAKVKETDLSAILGFYKEKEVTDLTLQQWTHAMERLKVK